MIFWPFYDALFSENYPRNRMKGILCTMERFDLAEDLSTKDDKANLSDKPKLIVAVVGKYA